MAAQVSLIIGVYNRQQYLAATIESVLAQTYPDFELLGWVDSDDLLTPDALEQTVAVLEVQPADSYDKNRVDRLRSIFLA